MIEYYSSKNNNEILSFAQKIIGLQIIMLNEAHLNQTH